MSDEEAVGMTAEESQMARIERALRVNGSLGERLSFDGLALESDPSKFSAGLDALIRVLRARAKVVP